MKKIVLFLVLLILVPFGNNGCGSKEDLSPTLEQFVAGGKPECDEDSDCYPQHSKCNKGVCSGQPMPECVENSDCYPKHSLCIYGLCAGKPQPLPPETPDAMTSEDSSGGGPWGDPNYVDAASADSNETSDIGHDDSAADDSSGMTDSGASDDSWSDNVSDSSGAGNDSWQGAYQCSGAGCIVCYFTNCLEGMDVVVWFGENQSDHVACDGVDFFESDQPTLCLWGWENPVFKFNLWNGGEGWYGGESATVTCNETSLVTPDGDLGYAGVQLVTFNELFCF